MFSLYRIFALLAYLFGTVAVLYGMLITQLPWYPRNKLEAVGIPGAIFGLGAGARLLSWLLMRRGRREVVIDDPLRWRWTERVLIFQGAVCGLLFLLLVASTLLH